MGLVDKITWNTPAQMVQALSVILRSENTVSLGKHLCWKISIYIIINAMWLLQFQFNKNLNIIQRLESLGLYDVSTQVNVSVLQLVYWMYL